MSLTNLLLNHADIKTLFGTIPNLKESLRSSDGGEPFPSVEAIIVPREDRATPTIGRAYDYFLRAFVQRINGIHDERADELAAGIGVELLLDMGGIDVRKQYEAIIQCRNAYIGGAQWDAAIISDCIALANMEQYYRSGTLPENGVIYVSSADIVDLERLARATERHSEQFLAKEGIICNPTFGEAVTHLIGGADGDLIVDDMLIDIKTESECRYKIGHWRQLIGYWILSRLTPSHKPQIRRLAIWNPRYCRLVSITTDDLCRAMDMEAFLDRFAAIITQPNFEGGAHLSSVERQRYIQAVQAMRK